VAKIEEAFFPTMSLEEQIRDMQERYGVCPRKDGLESPREVPDALKVPPPPPPAGVGGSFLWWLVEDRNASCELQVDPSAWVCFSRGWTGDWGWEAEPCVPPPPFL